MKSTTLVMTFLNDLGKKINVRIPYVKENLTKEQVGTLMDKIVGSNALTFDGSKVSIKNCAKIVAQSVDDIL